MAYNQGTEVPVNRNSVPSEVDEMEIFTNSIQVTEDSHLTSISLQRCQALVVKRYNKLLLLIGWHPFMKTNITKHTTLWAFLNIFYIGIIILFLCYSYVYDALNDTNRVLVYQIPKSITSPTEESILRQNQSLTTVAIQNYPLINNANTNQSDHNFSKLQSIERNTFRDIKCIISAYIIPSSIHFIVYIYGFIHFRVKENEQMDAIMEKVFLRTQATIGGQTRLISTTRWYLIISVIWVSISLITVGISMCTNIFPDLYISKRLYTEIWSKTVIIILQCIGKLLSLCVYSAVVVNFATQCEFFIHSIYCLCLQLQEKTLSLKEAMQEIVSVKDSLGVLNGPLSKMTSLCVLNFTILTALGTHALVQNANNVYLVWIFYIMFQLVSVFMFLFPLIQAARVTKTGEKLLKISLYMRVFGYKNFLNDNLDSFIIFVENAKLRAKLFSVPIKSAYLINSFTLILLFLIIFYQ